MAPEVCRICGGNNELKSILDQGPEMLEKFSKCANVQELLEGSLPNFICQQCDQDLDLSYKLRTESEKTARRLKKEIKGQPDVGEMASESKLETAASSINCEEEIKVNQQYTGVPSSIQMSTETSIESSIKVEYEKEKPVKFPLKIEPSDIDEEEFQMINNSNTVLENESNDSYKVYGSLESRPPSITPDQNDIKIEEVKLIPPDQISMHANDGYDSQEDYGSLDKHIEISDHISNKSKKCTCNICKQKFTQLGDLKRHMETHSDEYKYTCTTCFHSFRTHENLDIHVKRHHPKSDKNEQCSATQQWTPGVNIPKENQCDYCGKQLQTSLIYQEHVQRFHLNVTPPHTCKTCKKKYFTFKGLTRHEQTQHCSNKCDICLKSFKYLSHLKRHKVMHSKLPPQLYTCSICSDKFQHEDNLTVHMRVHTNEKLFKCKTCNTNFYTRNNLTQHERQQHSDNSRLYKCDICLKSFKRLAHLTQHKLLHSDLQPQYSCAICPAKFRHKHNLIVHMRIHSREKPFKCVLCSEEFAHSNSLKIHNKKFHSDTTTSGNDSELLKDNRLENDCAKTSKYESTMCIDFPEESEQQLPSTSETQIMNTKCSIIPQNIVNENSKATCFSLPLEYIHKDASSISTSTNESNFIEFIKVEEYQIVEQNFEELKTGSAK